MFTVGNYVMYGSQGVCKIEEIRQEDFSGQCKEYYILCPVDDVKMQIYVPCDAPTLVAQMRRLLTQEELMELIRGGMQDGALEWISDPRGRSEQFRNILQSGDRRQLFRLLRTLYLRREQQSVLGKKLYAADEQVFERAEKLLHGEVAVIMNISADEVKSFIGEQLAAQ